MDEEVKAMLVRARTALILDEPFFGQLVMNLNLVEDTSIPTLCVSRNTVRYSPAFIRTLPPNQIKAALAHEVGHCVLDSFGRRGDRDPRGWNIATDYKINEMLKDAGFELGNGWLYNPAYADPMTAEHIYELIPKDKNGNSPGTGDEGGALDDQDESSSADETDMSPTDWKTAVVQAATVARQQGKLPKAAERYVEAITSPKVDWRAQLRRFATERSRDDYSWARPNRRMLQYGIILPSLYSESMGEMVVVIDTSGSIDQPTLNAFGAEICAIQSVARPSKLHVIYCDAEVNHVDVFTPDETPQFKMHGGGGTDFCPPFEYIDKHGLQATCGAYLTDGYGRFPEQGPAFPFMWCMTTDVNPPWGETIRVEI